MSKSKYGIIIIAFMLLSLAVAGGVYWTQVQQHEADAEQAEILAQEEAFLKRFESLLNGFLQETGRKALAYKKRRKVMADLVKPENLKAPEYVQENYTLAQNLLPDLHIQIAKIMTSFEQMDDDVHALLKDRSAQEAASLSAKWSDVRQEQLNGYMQFFSFEQEILDAYHELMSVYYDTQGRFSVDQQTAAITFENKQDELNVWTKRSKVEALLEAQKNILKRRQEALEEKEDAAQADKIEEEEGLQQEQEAPEGGDAQSEELSP